jgi:pyrimidine operon attenuation protein / uracil phosphoribosyltransferase
VRPEKEKKWLICFMSGKAHRRRGARVGCFFMSVKAQALDAEGIRKVLIRIAHEIAEKEPSSSTLVLIGIRSRGEILARRLARLIGEFSRTAVPVGELDITLYRDDLSLLAANPIVHATEIPFDISGRRLVIVDDVLFTGRTIRAAMDALADLGRPESVELAVLVDRGHRELPIRADYVGKNLPTAKGEAIQVRLAESDGLDEVVVEQREEPG